MPGRKYPAGSVYKYGFNGKENDNEVKGEGNQQDYGMRIYDPRLGRFLSVGPLTQEYSELTPYQFASNRPIDGIDLDGLEWAQDEVITYDFMSPKLKIVTTNYIKVKVINQSEFLKNQSEFIEKADLFKRSLESKFTNIRPPLLLPDHIIKTEVMLDYTPLLDKEDPDYKFAFGQLIFKDVTSEYGLSTNGGVTTPFTRINGKTVGEINQFMIYISVGRDGRMASEKDLTNTSQHEGAHSGGMNHPWEFTPIEMNLLQNLNQTDPVIRSLNGNNIKTYLMNSGENPDSEIRMNNQSDFSEEALKAMTEIIRQKCTRTVNELKEQ